MSRYQSEENNQPEPKLHTKDKYFDPLNPQKATPISAFNPEEYAPKSREIRSGMYFLLVMDMLGLLLLLFLMMMKRPL